MASGKLLNEIRSMYVNSLVRVRVKGGESVSESTVVRDEVLSCPLGPSMCIWMQ